MDEESIDSDVVEDVRLAIYRGLAHTGGLPSLPDLLAVAGSSERLHECIERLAAARSLVLDADGDIVLAHPFATRSFGFSVMSAQTLWWGGCAWDAFALPHLVDCGEVLVATRCPACGQPLAWVVGRDQPPPGSEVAHFLVSVPHIWDDVVHSCANQLIFCSDGCVDRWLASRGESEGYRMNLDTLWRLASHWYDGRLDRGYQRRNPETSQAYLRGVGLVGPFWGT